MDLANEIVHKRIRDKGLYRFGPLGSVTPYSCVWDLSLCCYKGVLTLGSSFSSGLVSLVGKVILL